MTIRVIGVSCRISYYVFNYLYVSLSPLITSVGEERAIFLVSSTRNYVLLMGCLISSPETHAPASFRRLSISPSVRRRRSQCSNIFSKTAWPISYILCGASMERGNEGFFALSGSQDSRPAHML